MIEVMLMGGGRRFGAPYVYTVAIVGGTGDSYLIKLDSGLNEEWRVLMPFNAQTAPSFANGFVYIAGQKADGIGYVEKRDANDGSLVWSYSSQVSTSSPFRYTIRASSNNVFFGFSTSSFAGRLHSINSSNGARFNSDSYGTNTDVRAMFALPDDGVLIGLYGGLLRRHSSNGNLLWQLNSGETATSLITYDADTSRIYINGNKNYEFSTGGDLQATATSIRNPTSTDPDFFYSNNGGFLSKSAKLTSTQEWITQSRLTNSSNAIFHVAEDGYIYFSSDSELYCISPAGDIVEQSNLGGLSFRGISVEPGPYGSGFWN